MTAKFWVGGSGNWSDATNHWALSSGGAPGAGNLPTAADTVTFDVLSNTTAYTVTMNTATQKLCLDATFGAPLAGNVTLAGTQGWSISGSLTLYSGLIWTYTGAITFNGTSSKNITTAGTALTSAIIFNGASGGWVHQDNFTTSSTITLTQGTWNWNAKTITALRYASSGAVARTMTMTNGTLILGTGLTNTTIWDTSVQTNLVITNTGSTVTMAIDNSSSASLSFPCLFKPGGFTFNSLTITGTGYDQFEIFSDLTCAGTLTMTGANRSTGRFRLYSDTLGTARTLTAAVVALTNIDFEDITAAGVAAPFTGTSLGNCNGLTNITTTAPVTRFWVGNAGTYTDEAHWSTSTGGSGGASFPLPQDTATFDASSFSSSQSVTLAVENGRSGQMTWTGVTNTPVLNVGKDLYFYQGMTLSASMTVSGVQTYNLVGSSAYNWAQQGLTTTSTFAINALGGTYTFTSQFGGSLGSVPALSLSNGALDANDFDVYITGFTSSNAFTRTLSLGNGTWYLRSTGTQWNMATVTNLTFHAEGSTIECNGTTVSACTFSGGGLTYNNLRINKTGTGSITFAGSNTFNVFSMTSSAVHSIIFTNGTTTTFASWTVMGTPGNVYTIAASLGANYNFVKTGGGVVSVDYLSISRSQATPANTWYAGTHSTDGGNNTGWNFTAPPASGSIQVVVVCC